MGKPRKKIKIKKKRERERDEKHTKHCKVGRRKRSRARRPTHVQQTRNHQSRLYL